MVSCNLLPNASFELDFGDNQPSNWADTHTPLTLMLASPGLTMPAQPGEPL